MKKAVKIPSDAVSYHLYFESSFSPESFAIYNINEKHALGGNLNASRVQHFVKKIASSHPFLPDDIIPRMERILCKLHYGWCSHAMELIRGDLLLIKREIEKSPINDAVIADIGKGIDLLLDTFDVAIIIDDTYKKLSCLRAKSRELQKALESKLSFSHPLNCWKTTLVHPESSITLRAEFNGSGLAGSKPSYLQLIDDNIELDWSWQLFFETLTRALQTSGYLEQENLETAKGNLSFSHLPELQKIVGFIDDRGGRIFLDHVARGSPLYTFGPEVKVLNSISYSHI